MTQCYVFAGAELLTAQWVQAWGSILGATLGAGLAVYGAVWFDRRKAGATGKAYREMIVSTVKRIDLDRVQLNSLIDAGASSSDVRLAGMELSRAYGILSQFSPFVELGSYYASAALIDLSDTLMRVINTLPTMDVGVIDRAVSYEIGVELASQCRAIGDRCRYTLDRINEARA